MMACIKTYARLKPYKKRKGCSSVKDDGGYFETDDSRIIACLPDPTTISPQRSSHHVAQPTITYEFQFHKLFNENVDQASIFDTVAIEIIDGFLNGYNGTIFAYGQTGSGKTYTIEGEINDYSKRGLSSRALTKIYKSLEKRDDDISVNISYLEIYQECAYDLLNPAFRSGATLNFPKVFVTEGPLGTCVLRNLNIIPAPSEGIAQSLLIQAQANRRVAETPTNQRSSRSHAVFTIHLTSQEQGSETKISSKLHLVDLAGSERCAKSGVDGRQLVEAKSINLSLHHLEQVIVALQNHPLNKQARTRNGFGSSVSLSSVVSHHSSRPSSASSTGFFRHYHVPYRNSLLTMVLRDSLGGNCLTAMVANVSLDNYNVGETMSTCRFSQRVAQISNYASRNEVIDDKTIIKRLKQRIRALEKHIVSLKSQNQAISQEWDEDGGPCQPSVRTSSKRAAVSSDDLALCVKVVHGFISGALTDPIEAGINEPSKFCECLRMMKTMLLKTESFTVTDPEQSHKQPSSSPNDLQRPHPTSSEGSASSSGISSEPNYNRPNRRRANRKSSSAPGVQDQTSAAAVNSNNNTSAAVNNNNNTQQVYQTPFKQQRQLDIAQLEEQVDRERKEHVNRKVSITERRLNQQRKHLQILIAQIQNDMDMLDDRLANQHAFILQLRHREADADTIEQEQLAAFQLRKKKARLEQQLQILITHYRTQEEGGPQPIPVEDSEISPPSQVGPDLTQSRKNDRIHSRTVLDNLKVEAEKQEKLNAHLERAELANKRNELALREMATREKLRSLKQLLKTNPASASLSPPIATTTRSHGDGDVIVTNDGHSDDTDHRPGPKNDWSDLDQSSRQRSGLTEGSGQQQVDDKSRSREGQQRTEAVSSTPSDASTIPPRNFQDELSAMISDQNYSAFGFETGPPGGPGHGTRPRETVGVKSISDSDREKSYKILMNEQQQRIKLIRSNLEALKAGEST